MFSIIIPLYNKAAYIEKAIQSVLTQTYQEFELIVVDDGSKDIAPIPPDRGFKNSPLECMELMGNKARYIRQENQGVSVARNNGVKLAKYPFIAFLDADDWWEPTYLEEMKALVEAYPQAGIYGSGYYIIKNSQKRIAPIGIESNFEMGIINYFQVYSKMLFMPLWTGATVIKKSIFESENGFKPQLKLGEDFDLWVRVAIKFPVAFLNKPLAYYNQDVELENRAIGEKLYEPDAHILFGDYGELYKNQDFRFLYERLALYGLLPYYLQGKNKKEVNLILSGINWKNHKFKYNLYYRFLPKGILRLWMQLMKLGSELKKRIQ